MYLSLFAKLKELEGLGILALAPPSIALATEGEGRYTYKGQPLEFLTEYTGPAPGNPGIKLREPCDVAWCPAEDTFLAAAQSASEKKFKPLDEPLIIKGRPKGAKWAPL